MFAFTTTPTAQNVYVAEYENSEAIPVATFRENGMAQLSITDGSNIAITRSLFVVDNQLNVESITNPKTVLAFTSTRYKTYCTSSPR